MRKVVHTVMRISTGIYANIASTTYPGSNPRMKLSAVPSNSLIKYRIGCSKRLQLYMRSTYRKPNKPNKELLQPRKAKIQVSS